MNTLFAIVLIAIAACAVAALTYSLWAIFHHPSIKRERERFKQQVHEVLQQLAHERGFELVDDFELTFTGTTRRAHIDYMLFGEKFCYCIVVAKMDGAIQGAPDDSFWIWYAPDGKAESIQNLFAINRRNAADLESIATDTHVSKTSLVLPVLVLPNSTAVDPRLATNAQGDYIFLLKYLKKGLANIEDTAAVPPLVKDGVQAMATRIRLAKNQPAQN